MVVFLLFVIAAVLFGVDAVRSRGNLTAIGLCLVSAALAIGAAPGAGIG